MRGITLLVTVDGAPDATYFAGWVITTASWAKGTQPGDTGHSRGRLVKNRTNRPFFVQL